MKRILVVEDEALLARTVQLQLERRGYAVATAPDGDAALDAVGREKPDLLVLDVQLPGTDGFTVLERLKADPETAEIPVVMLTARADDEAIFRGWAGGVHGYLTKPFEVADLLAHVARVLDETAGGV